eukprot:EG_transcript_8824
MQVADFVVLSALPAGSDPDRRVFRVQNQLLGMEFALKVTKLYDPSDEALLAALTESRLLAKLEHPNVIRMHNCWAEDDFVEPSFATAPEGSDPPPVDPGGCRSSSSSAEDACRCPMCAKAPATLPSHPPARFLFMQLDLCESTLRDWMDSLGPSQRLAATTRVSSISAQRLSLVQQLCKGLEYLHEAGVSHNNLKPSNVCLQNGTLKIIDFHLAATSESPSHPPLLPSLYRPPGEGRSTSLDVFSLGCIFLEMSRCHQGLSIAERHREVLLAATSGSVPDVPHRCLIAAALAPNAADRPKVTAVLQEVSTALGLQQEPASPVTPGGPFSFSKASKGNTSEPVACLRMILDAAVVADETGTILAVNAVALELFGYEEAELLGANIAKLMPPPFPSLRDATQVPALVGQPRSLQVPCKSGQLKPCIARLGHQERKGSHIFLACFQPLPA